APTRRRKGERCARRRSSIQKFRSASMTYLPTSVAGSTKPTARPRLLIVLLGGEDGSGATSDDARSSRFSAARLRGCSRHARSRLARSTAPSFWAQLNAKRLEMLKEACPRMSSNLESQLPAVRDRDSAVVRRGSRRGVRARQVAFASALYPTACSFL